VKRGTLPAGVAEVTVGPAAEAGEPVPAAAGVPDAAGVVDVPGVGLAAGGAAAPAPAPVAATPIAPESEETETWEGRTRPNSWKT